MMGSFAPRPRRRVLVVEDDEDSRKLLVYRLCRLDNYEVDQAGNGVEAIETVVSRPPDLILMDINMPVMNGLEAMRRIRALPGKAATVPIIALSADCLDGAGARCVRAGASDTMAKPLVDPTSFKAKVGFWLAHRHGDLGVEGAKQMLCSPAPGTPG